LINRIRVFNNRIGFHFQGYHWNSTPIANAIWWFEILNTHKDFTPPSKNIWQWLLVKQHKTHTPQRRKWVEITRSTFYYQKFHCKINGGDNPPSIGQLKSKMKAFSSLMYGDQKKIQSPRDWQRKDLVAIGLEMKNFGLETNFFWSPQD
jgi:hypothetical protein